MKFPYPGLTLQGSRERSLGCYSQVCSTHPLPPRNLLGEGGHPLEPPAGRVCPAPTFSSVGEGLPLIQQWKVWVWVMSSFLHLPVPQQQRLIS